MYISKILSMKLAGNPNEELVFQTRESGTLRVRRDGSSVKCAGEQHTEHQLLSMDFPANPPEPISDFKARMRLVLGVLLCPKCSLC